MTRRRQLWRLLPLPVTLLTLQAGPAAGGEVFEPVADPAHQSRALLAKELTRSRKATADEAAEAQDWRRIHVSKGAGLEVRQSFRLGDRDLVFGVKGPLMKKRKLGLSFEVRF